MRCLTSEQYVKIDEVVQTLPQSRRHAFLVTLVRKLNLDERENRGQTLPDAVLSTLISAALSQTWRPQNADPHAVAAAKELDRLIKLHSNR